MKKRNTVSRGVLYSNYIFRNMDWNEVWLLPEKKYNKVKEVQIHIAKLSDIVKNFSFCNKIYTPPFV